MIDNLRTRLVLGIVLASVMAMAAHIVWRDRQATWSRTEALAVGMAKVVDAHVARTVRSVDIALQQTISMVQQAGDLNDGDLNGIRTKAHWERMREYAANMDGGMNLWLFDRAGDTVIETAREFPGRKVNISDRAYFRSALNGEGLFIGPAIRSKATDNIIFTISRPVRDRNGTVIGGVAAAMDTQWLADFYALMNFGLDTTITVFRLDGGVVARRPDLASVIGKSNRNGQLFQEQLPQAPTGFYVSRSVFDDQERMAAYRLVADLGVVVYAGIESGSAFAAWRERSLWFLGEVAVMLGLIVAAILWGARSVRRGRASQQRLLEAEAVTAQMNAELHLAKRDPLTGLPSRALFLEMAETMRQRCAARGLSTALLFIDLDGFKDINDRFGHGKGDEILMGTADALRRLTRDHDLTGRLGGDEFTVCVAGSAPVIREIAAGIAERIITQVAALQPGLGCSIGIALLSENCPDVICALRHADAAMYEAKRAGKGRSVIADNGYQDCGDCRMPVLVSR